MATSPEYPDLPWVPPKAWNSGRAAGQPTVIVIHTTEGSEGLKSAEDGAAYDQRRTDGTSTHYFCDQDTVVQCVRTTDRANAAKASGNKIGIHYELCGKAAQTPDQWHDEASLGTFRNAAKQAARDAKKHGLPVRRLTAAQVRAGEKGFCAHNDISDAFGESNHTDPGRNYPWAEFLALVNDYMEDGVSQADVIAALKSPEGQKLLAQAFNVDNVVTAPGDPKPGTNPDGTPVNTHWAPASYLKETLKATGRLEAALKTLSGKDFTDEAAIAQAVLAGLDPQKIADAIPADVAEQVVDLLAARMAG